MINFAIAIEQDVIDFAKLSEKDQKNLKGRSHVNVKRHKDTNTTEYVHDTNDVKAHASKEAQRILCQARRLNHIRDCAARLRQPNIQNDGQYKHRIVKEVHSSVNAFNTRANESDEVNDVQRHILENICDMNFNYFKLTLEADRHMIRYKQVMNAQSKASRKREANITVLLSNTKRSPGNSKGAHLPL